MSVNMGCVIVQVCFWQEAADCASSGLEQDPANADLRRLHQKACMELKRSSGDAVGAPPSMEEVKRTVRNSTKSGDIPPAVMREALIHSRQNDSTLPNLEKAGGVMPDNFGHSFLDSQPLPPGCNKQVAGKLLEAGSSDAVEHWMALSQERLKDHMSDPEYIKMQAELLATNLKGSGLTPDDMGTIRSDDPLGSVADHSFCKLRVRDCTKARDLWFTHAPIGTLNIADRPGVSTGLHPPFADVVQHALPIAAGGVHVAVGFVDLGVLAETLAVQQEEEERADGEKGGGDKVAKLQWVGVEQSAFCCAKTLVVVQMLKWGVDPDHIVQVCYHLVFQT